MNVSVIIPIYKGESTITKTLDSLLVQSVSFSELIIINDGSPDNSAEIITDYLRTKKVKRYRLITHKVPIGLAATYNQGITLANSELVVTLHQDVILFKDSLETLIQPFKKDNAEIVASYHVVLHPIDVWKKYNFWQKCFFSRLIGKNFYGLDGKFDCFNKKALIQVGLFDGKHFRTAGEDGDMVYKLRAIGRVVSTEAKIIHLHSKDPNFGIKQLYYKQAQYSEAQGSLFRRHKHNIKEYLSAFFREILLLSLLVPYLRFLGALLILIYLFLYTNKVYYYEFRNPRIYLLPFVNLSLLLVSLFFSVRGYMSGKEKV